MKRNDSGQSAVDIAVSTLHPARIGPAAAAAAVLKHYRVRYSRIVLWIRLFDLQSCFSLRVFLGTANA